MFFKLVFLLRVLCDTARSRKAGRKQTRLMRLACGGPCAGDCVDCEVCGKTDAKQYAVVEGVRLAVCAACSKHGRPAGGVAAAAAFKRTPAVEREPRLNPDYAVLLQEARRKTGLSVEELAKKVAEPESFIKKIEAGKLRPTDGLARRLERALKVRLVE